MDSFSNVFTQRENPEEMPSISLARNPLLCEKPTILNILHESELFESKGEIRRLILQGAIKVDGLKVDSVEHEIIFTDDEERVYNKSRKKDFFESYCLASNFLKNGPVWLLEIGRDFLDRTFAYYFTSLCSTFWSDFK